ncbi:DUF1868 domain-containing protein [Methylobacterium sp. E-066]|uniref:DUF1868 domain-containing protein n=1 Tax=Methylobacterium sp. E-066 TaxID=2836584 RepID=UPI001FBB36F9|nr:DUF1868 domain-containing protein [Methylobacterium sp. E-066]MCJ2141606.1 DUF1868 domain-containing protein [Methylobacterium sp. E-066]
MSQRDLSQTGRSLTMTRRHVLHLSGAAAVGSFAGLRSLAASAADGSKPFPWIGTKFTPDGQVLRCPGNTIICHIEPSNPATAPLAAFRAALEAEPYAHKFTFTPPSSYHMTVFEGVIDFNRKPSLWPADLPLDASVEACNQLFIEKLEAFDLGCEPRFRMKVLEGDGNVDVRPGAGIYLVPADEAEATKLRGVRDRLSDLLKLHQPGHDTYKFHTTQTYAIKPLSEIETSRYRAVRRDSINALAAAMPVLELGAPELCLFDDMFAFNPRLYLRPRQL